MSVLVTFNDGDRVVARMELYPGMVAPAAGQAVVIKGETWEVIRVVIDFTPSLPDVSQVLLCRVRRLQVGGHAAR